MVSRKVGGGRVEEYAGLQPNLPNGNGIRQVTRVDAFICIEEGALRFLNARYSLERECRVCARQISLNGSRDLAVVGSWSVAHPSNCEGAVVVGWIGIGSQYLGQSERASSTGGKKLIKFALSSVRVSNLEPQLRSAQVRIDAVAPCP